MQTQFLLPADNIQNNNKRANQYSSWFWTVLSILLLSFLVIFPTHAHRGAKNEIDMCRMKIDNERIHLSAYTPEFSQGQSYCQYIPYVGKTELVFDYEGKKLRNVLIEFEITKEPESTRIYHHPAEQIKKGSVDASIDFSQYGEGEYLVHITTDNNGDKQDYHLPLFVGMEEEKTPWSLYIFLVTILALVVLFAILTRANKNPVKTEDE